MKQEKQNWIVRMQCVVTRDVIVNNCTKKEAEESPFEFAVDEIDVDMRDWEVTSIKLND